MMRVVIENVLLFLLPTVIYVAYVLLTRSESTAGTVINEAPLVWLFLIGAMVAAFNIWMTVRAVPATLDRRADVPDTGLAPGAAATPAE